VEHELNQTFASPEFEADKWFKGALHALDAIRIFWNGLDRSRKRKTT
jgi:hypothetical protein